MNRGLVLFFGVAFALLFFIAATAQATGPSYIAGVQDSITITCTNPTARTDGRALNWATEGGHVDYYVGQDPALAAAPILTGRMGTGCQSTPVNLKALQPAQYYLHVKSFDAQERVDGPSVALPFVRVATVPPPGETRTNLALAKVTTTSSIEGQTFTGAQAVDGLMTTRWASILPGKDAESIIVDLGAAHSVDHVIVQWQAYAKAFNVQVSNDKITWTTVTTLTGQLPSSGAAATSDIRFPPAVGRYVRVLGITRGTQWGYSIYEVKIYGNPPAPTPCTSPETAACSSAYNSCMAACNQ